MEHQEICEFVNSTDVRAYLRDIGYEFNAPQAAWLVYNCRRLTMEERHRAWREIIRDMPDCAVEERLNLQRIDSFHAFLNAFMALEQWQGILKIEDCKAGRMGLAFDGMCFDFPSPFKRGDILVDCTGSGMLGRAPFVLSYITTWDSKKMLSSGFGRDDCPACGTWADFDKVTQRLLRVGDYSDCHAKGTVIVDGKLCREDHIIIAPTDLAYFSGPLEGAERQLQVISQYEKGEAGRETLANCRFLDDYTREAFGL